MDGSRKEETGTLVSNGFVLGRCRRMVRRRWVSGGEGKEEPPDFAVAINRLKWDVEALLELTAGEEPCVQKCGAKESMSAFYLVEDASRNGLGSVFF